MNRLSLCRAARSALVASCVVLLSSAASEAQGREEYFFFRHAGQQTALDVNLFEPSTSPQSIFSLELARVPMHLTFTAGLFVHYANQPLVARLEDGTRPIVAHDLRAELQGSLGLFQFLEFGLAAPVAFTQHAQAIIGGQGGIDGVSSGAGSLVGSFRMGDVRVHVKAPVLRAPIELAARVAITLPTGSIGGGSACERAIGMTAMTAACMGQTLTPGQAFSSAISWTIMPQLLLSKQLGPAVVAANLGYRFRDRNGIASGGRPLVIDDELQWGLGARLAVHRMVHVGAEINGRIGVMAATGETIVNGQVVSALNGSSWPIDAVLGAELRPTDALAIDLGLRRGLTGGYGAETIGLFAGARFSVTGRTCANGPEDYDGFEDNDYCEDPDNDADGILDGNDRCPNDAEDRDGVLDEDGCPDPDNDADGRLDEDDRCPVEPEDFDGHEDDDGCPDPDNDRDGIPDSVDQCDNDPEDLDRFEDEDGCPEPGPQPVVVTRTESRLLLSQRIYFEFDSDVIRNVSFDILNEVAATIRRNPDISMLRVEGHTDSAGVAQYNLDLSFRRARAVVEYLVQRGVERSRLDFRGYGSQRLAGPDDTPDGQALNRRVEFVIVTQGAGNNAPQSNEAPSQGNDGSREARPRRRRRLR